MFGKKPEPGPGDTPDTSRAGDGQINTEFEVAAINELRRWRELAQSDPKTLAAELREAASVLDGAIPGESDALSGLARSLEDVATRLASVEEKLKGSGEATPPSGASEPSKSSGEGKLFSPRGNPMRASTGDSLREIAGY